MGGGGKGSATEEEEEEEEEEDDWTPNCSSPVIESGELRTVLRYVGRRSIGLMSTRCVENDFPWPPRVFCIQSLFRFNCTHASGETTPGAVE